MKLHWMKHILRSVCIAVCVTVVSGEWFCGAETRPPETPSLSEVVFIGLRPTKELNPAHYPKEVQPCLQTYLAAIAPNSYLRTFEVPSNSEKAVRARRRIMVEQMVAILGQEVHAEAEMFSEEVPLMGEWEGMSEGPVGEANFVDNWLRKRSGTPIAPFLHLFKAHRLRAGYEAARSRQEEDLWPILAQRYREAIKRARSSTNSLILCIADDLEAQPFVYLKGYERP